MAAAAEQKRRNRHLIGTNQNERPHDCQAINHGGKSGDQAMFALCFLTHVRASLMRLVSSSNGRRVDRALSV
jgi:hypothetical protein